MMSYAVSNKERHPISSNSGVASALSTGLLVDTNLETSIPDTYRPPHAPISCDVTTNNPRSPLNNSRKYLVSSQNHLRKHGIRH